MDAPNLILVHGIFNQGRMFWKMAHHFSQRGYQVTAPDLVPNSASTSLTLLSEQLDRHIREQIPEGQAYHLLGFSMGGLISRHYLQEHADLDRVLSFTTLSTPHHGTLNAWLMPWPGWREMRKNSAFLKQLEANDHRIAERLHPLSLWTPMDLTILPANSSVWEIAQNESIPVAMHPVMRHSTRVIQRVETHLEEANLART